MHQAELAVLLKSLRVGEAPHSNMKMEDLVAGRPRRRDLSTDASLGVCTPPPVVHSAFTLSVTTVYLNVRTVCVLIFYLNDFYIQRQSEICSFSSEASLENQALPLPLHANRSNPAALGWVAAYDGVLLHLPGEVFEARLLDKPRGCPIPNDGFDGVFW